MEYDDKLLKFILSLRENGAVHVEIENLKVGFQPHILKPNSNSPRAMQEAGDGDAARNIILQKLVKDYE